MNTYLKLYIVNITDNNKQSNKQQVGPLTVYADAHSIKMIG